MFIAALFACWSSDEVHETYTTKSPEPYRPKGTDVIVIVLDTLRADHLSQYGHSPDTSPGLAAFAKVATRFDSAWAPAPWTLPSSTTILTGQHPLRHGMRHPGDILPENATTMAEWLRQEGWHTAGFSHNVSMAPRHGMNQGFDTFLINTGKVLAYPHARKLFVAAEKWLDQQGSEPVFMYAQPMNCHGPYKVPESHAKTLLGRKAASGFTYYEGLMGKIMSDRDTAARKSVKSHYLTSAREQYDTAIRYETDEVGKFFGELRKRGRFNNALIIITADHGEEFFEHGGFSHGYSLHGEVLHVPLFVKLPGQSVATVATSPVSLSDILPTVLEAAEISPGAAVLDGTSLLPLLRGLDRVDSPRISEVDWKSRIVGQAIASAGWKLIEVNQDYSGITNARKLFDIQTDPGEAHDVAAAHPDEVVRLSAILSEAATRLSSGFVPESRLSGDDQKQLEALGYIE